MIDNYNYKLRRITCIRCSGKLKPTNQSDLMGNADQPIHVQIYQCVDCGFENHIPVYEPCTRLGDESLLMKSPDESHNDKYA